MVIKWTHQINERNNMSNESRTKIFKSRAKFIRRSDQDVNGVSEEFAAAHPDYAEQNKTNYGCWNCSGCTDCMDCRGCINCSDCRRCIDCTDCSVCEVGVILTGNNNCYWNESFLNAPKITDIHQKILESCRMDGALNMNAWHSGCGTTHCRAGWAVHLAGEKGREIEKSTNTAFAAMLIFKASSPIRVASARFYDSDEAAMADIERCAAEESAL